MLVAILDDEPTRRAEMQSCMNRTVPAALPEFFDNAPDMIAWLARHIDDVALVSLAHDLGPNRLRDGMLFDPGSGRDVTDFLGEMDRRFPVVVHTQNGPAGRTMVAMLERYDWRCVRVEPDDDLGWVTGKWLPLVAELLDESGAG